MEQLPFGCAGLVGTLQVLLQPWPAGEDVDEALVVAGRDAWGEEEAVGDVLGRADAGARAQCRADDADRGDHHLLAPQHRHQLAQVDLVIIVGLSGRLGVLHGDVQRNS